MSGEPHEGAHEGAQHRDTNLQAAAKRYGSNNNIKFHEAHEPHRPHGISDLVDKPVIRQWIEHGKLYREASPRELPRIELFFDLLYVGVIRQLAEVAVASPNGLGVARFLLTFWPSWSVWEEARRFSNVSGTDDLLHRMWILIGMICIMGYSVNASAIPIHGSAAHAASEAAPAAASVGSEHIAMIGRWLFQRAEAAAAEGEGAEHEDSFTPVHAAAAFWLIIKLSRVIVLWIYAWRLPEFRVSQFLGGCAVLVPMFVYLPLIWVKSRSAQIALAAVGICVDLIRVDFLMFYIYGRYLARKRRREMADAPAHSFLTMADLHLKLPAINIEHSIERSGAFVVIVLGELVMNVLYEASPGNYGAGAKFGKAALGLMVAWAINYLYTIPNDEHIVQYEHALRRSWLTGILFNFLHWPLCASLVLASAAAHAMITTETVTAGVKWYWGCGLGFTLLFTCIIDSLHRNMEPWRAARIPRAARFAFGVAGALALILFPLSAARLSSTGMMAIAVGITWAVLAVYVFGTLPTKYATFEEHREEPVVTVTDLRRSTSRASRTSLHSRRSHRDGAKGVDAEEGSQERTWEDDMAIAANT